jgi:hypothetical protein
VDREPLIWWAGLCAVSVLNVLAWAWSAALIRRRPPGLPAETLRFGRWQLLLSAGYVFGCAYRSALPVFDVQRLCLFDTWLSSVIVGRTVATVAELCFAAQWALLLNGASRLVGSRRARIVACALVPLIGVAELCSWHAVLTTSNLGHVFEESIWGLCAAGVALSLLQMLPRASRELRPLLAFCGVAGLGYVVYMFGVDVPMYWTRWVTDETTGRPYFSVSQGAVDASTRWLVSHRWDDWKTEVVWMSLYFSTAVWVSIGLIHTPLTIWAAGSPGKVPGAA